MQIVGKKEKDSWKTGNFSGLQFLIYIINLLF